MDVCVEAALLSGVHTVLTDVVPIVSSVEDIGVVQLPGMLQHLDHGLDHFVNRLQRTQTSSLVLVIVLNHRVIQQWQILDPAYSSLDFGIEVGIAGNLVVLEEMAKSLVVLRHVRVERWCKVDCSMRSNRRVHQEEWLLVCEGFLEETIRFLRRDIWGILPSIIDRRVAVSGHGRVAVLVSMRIEQEV